MALDQKLVKGGHKGFKSCHIQTVYRFGSCLSLDYFWQQTCDCSEEAIYWLTYTGRLSLITSFNPASSHTWFSLGLSYKTHHKVHGALKMENPCSEFDPNICVKLEIVALLNC